MFVLSILYHNLLGTNRPEYELTGSGYETSEPGYESSGYETSDLNNRTEINRKLWRSM